MAGNGCYGDVYTDAGASVNIRMAFAYAYAQLPGCFSEEVRTDPVSLAFEKEIKHVFEMGGKATAGTESRQRM